MSGAFLYLGSFRIFSGTHLGKKYTNATANIGYHPQFNALVSFEDYTYVAKTWHKQNCKISFFSALNQCPTYTLPLFHTNGLGLILAPDISSRDILVRTFYHWNFSAQGHFCTRTFQHGYILAPWTFFGTGTFQYKDISAWTFWHIYILTPCKAI